MRVSRSWDEINSRLHNRKSGIKTRKITFCFRRAEAEEEWERRKLKSHFNIFGVDRVVLARIVCTRYTYILFSGRYAHKKEEEEKKKKKIAGTETKILLTENGRSLFFSFFSFLPCSTAQYFLTEHSTIFFLQKNAAMRVSAINKS